MQRRRCDPPAGRPAHGILLGGGTPVVGAGVDPREEFLRDVATGPLHPTEIDDSVNEFAAEGLVDQIILLRRRLYPDPEFKHQAAALRRFNRFYFHRMRPLKDAMTDFGFHPSELRVIREIGEAPQGVSASYMAWKLHMEQARVSRILSFFKALGWTTEEKDPRDGMLRLVPPKDRDRLLHAMAEIQRILGTVRI